MSFPRHIFDNPVKSNDANMVCTYMDMGSDVFLPRQTAEARCEAIGATLPIFDTKQKLASLMAYTSKGGEIKKCPCLFEEELNKINVSM